MKTTFKGGLNQLSKSEEKAFLRLVTNQAGIIAVNFSKERFIDKNWLDRGRKPWKKTIKPRGSTLVTSGRLKRSIRKISQGDYYVYIGTDVPYAKAHNEGLEIKKTVNVKAHKRKIKQRARSKRHKKVQKTKNKAFVNVRSHTRSLNIKMPQRQFLGESAILDRRIQRFMEKELNIFTNKYIKK